MKIITGSGRSGTSFVAKIIDKLAPLQGEYLWEEEVRAGMETKDIVDANKMLFSMNGKSEPYATDWLNKNEIVNALSNAGTLIRAVGDRYSNQWVKDPLFSKTLQVWIDAHVAVERVIICTREPFKSMQSAIASKRGFEPIDLFTPEQIETEMQARQGYLWDTILRFGISYDVIRYEHLPDDLMVVLRKQFPQVSETILAQLIVDEWNPKL